MAPRRSARPFGLKVGFPSAHCKTCTDCLILQHGANLADVARKAGVSEATVSRVSTTSPALRATRPAVLTALDVIGYDVRQPANRARLMVGSCCRNCRTRSSRPSPRSWAGPWPSAASRRALHADRRRVRGRLRRPAAGPARFGMSLPAATTPRRMHRTTTTSGCGAAPADRVRERRHRAYRLSMRLEDDAVAIEQAKGHLA